MKAKYAGTCRICRRPIAVDEEIEWSKDAGACHGWCAQRERDDNPEPPNALLNQIFARQAAARRREVVEVESEAERDLANPPADGVPAYRECSTHGRFYGPGPCPVCAVHEPAKAI